MTNCCDEVNTSQTAVSTPADCLQEIDCNARAQYSGADGVEFTRFMPVSPTAVPGQVQPQLDGVGAIGLALETKTTTTDNPSIVVVRRGRICWRDLAQAIGADETSESEWWSIHLELIQREIYVSF